MLGKVLPATAHDIVCSREMLQSRNEKSGSQWKLARHNIVKTDTSKSRFVHHTVVINRENRHRD